MSETENVIKISDWLAREKQIGPIDIPPSWLFDLRTFVGVNGYEGTILSFNDDQCAFPDNGVGERLNRFADCLDMLSFMLRQQAENMEPTERGHPLATALVFENSAVRVRVNDSKVVTPDQFEWLDRRFDDAKGAARPGAPLADQGARE